MADKVQKLREEVERLKTKNETYLDKEYAESTKWYKHGAYDICFQLLNFIDSLPEEPSVKGITWEDVNTLDTLINQVRWEFPNGIGEKSFGLAVLEKFQDYQDGIEEPASEDLEEEITKCYKSRNDLIMTRKQFGELIHHFAEWVRNHFEDKSEMVNEDLEEAASKYVREDFHERSRADFKAGAEWQKQQMMKDAVETTIVNDWQYGKDPDHAIITAIHQRISGFNVGDKVKFIILKTEQL